MAEVVRVASAPVRRTQALRTARARRRYAIIVASLFVAATLFAIGLLVWNNPMPYGTAGFWRIVRLRVTSLIVMTIVAACQAIATVSFQKVTNNRIITPSIMGFESLYVAIRTAAVYFFGVAGLVSMQGVRQFVFQIVVMVGVALALYSWLFTGRYRNDLQAMLLIGIVIGGGLRAVSTFMQRLLTPSEFDVLAARLFGSVSNADPAYLPIAIPLCVGAGALLWARARRLNVLALGRDASIRLGFDYRRELVTVLLLVSVLMAVSTALIGPMTFFGFLVATIAYQLADSYDHRLIFPVAVLSAFVLMFGAYFVLRHVFYAQGAVSIIIELVGGLAFLVILLRRGRL